MIQDKITKSLKEKKIVIWEECARDGAQAKTIMTAEDRINIAKSTSAIFGEKSVEHVVFGVGFPSICKEEFETIRKVADNVDNCYLAANGRAMIEDVKLCIDSVKNAKYGRIAIVIPGSEIMADVMYHSNLKSSISKNCDLIKYALDNGQGLPLDLQYADAISTHPEILAEHINKSHQLGVSTIGLGDSFGKFYPNIAVDFFKTLWKNIDPEILLSTHFHNDIGLSLMNNIEAIKNGIYLITTSWLGLGERSGLLATELFVFLMSFENNNLDKKFGFDFNEFFYVKPDLKKLYQTAHLVSEITGVPLKVTDPLIGTGVNTISTGTPFVNPVAFQPFDTEKILGAPQKVYASHLANSRVLTKVTENIGLVLTKDEISTILKFIKSEAYRRKKAIFSDEEIKDIVLKLRKND